MPNFLLIFGALPMDSEPPVLPPVIEIVRMYWNCLSHLHPNMSKIHFFASSTLISKNFQSLPLFCFRSFPVCLSLPLQISSMIIEAFWLYEYNIKEESYHHRWIVLEVLFFACTHTNFSVSIHTVQQKQFKFFSFSSYWNNFTGSVFLLYKVRNWLIHQFFFPYSKFFWLVFASEFLRIKLKSKFYLCNPLLNLVKNYG